MFSGYNAPSPEAPGHCAMMCALWRYKLTCRRLVAGYNAISPVVPHSLDVQIPATHKAHLVSLLHCIPVHHPLTRVPILCMYTHPRDCGLQTKLLKVHALWIYSGDISARSNPESVLSGYSLIQCRCILSWYTWLHTCYKLSQAKCNSPNAEQSDMKRRHFSMLCSMALMLHTWQEQMLSIRL